MINAEANALLFGTSRVTYRWIPQDPKLTGICCVFTDEFLIRSKSGVVLDDLPIFKSGEYPVFLVDDQETNDEIEFILRKMPKEIASEYVYKYDLLSNYLMELIHYGQKLQPAAFVYPSHNAAVRVTTLFIELPERQFPIESLQQKLKLHTAKDYAARLSVQANHMNKVLKGNTNKITTELISNRIMQEAKILLKETDWIISEIAYSLAFRSLG